MFIIIAIIIIGVAFLLYLLTSRPETTVGFDEKNPTGFIQSCLEDKLATTVETVSLQGGNVAPELSILYDNSDIEYLCYTSEYYNTCSVQRPLLKAHIEEEIEEEIEGKVVSCFNQLKTYYEDKNYNVLPEIRGSGIIVELLPDRIMVNAGRMLTITKTDTKTYDSFIVILNNNLYELVSIANSIINWESNYGEAETTIYMNYYHDLKVEKKKQQDGSTIYILTEKSSGDKFQFAVRSKALPPGYGVDGIALT